jgi:hypothetical protein
MPYTTNFQWIEPQIGLQRIVDVSTVQMHPLGTIRKAKDAGSNNNGEGEFMYVKGVANGARGAMVTIAEDDYSTALLAPDAIGQVGVLMADLTAGTFGWAQISGKAVAKVGAGYVDNALVYATATAGTSDDAAVAGDRVKRARGASAIDVPETGMAEIELGRPFVDDGSAA